MLNVEKTVASLIHAAGPHKHEVRVSRQTDDAERHAKVMNEETETEQDA